MVLQALLDPLCHHEAVLHSKRTCAVSLTAASTELAELPELLVHFCCTDINILALYSFAVLS